MQYIVIDLEWNGSYSKKAHGYFNEIIEVGAVKVDEQMRMVDTFRAAIKPVVSKKLSTIVTDLTNITAEELEDGTTFTAMMRQLSRWMGNEPSTVLTWSTTDLLVLMENCRYFTGRQEIPFLQNYMDFQAYAQERMGVDAVVNKKLITAGRIFKFTLSNKVRFIKYMSGTDAEVLEYIVAPDTEITKRPLKEMNFPKNAIIGGLIRGNDLFIAVGDTHIQAYDRVAVFALPEAVKEVDRFFK